METTCSGCGTSLAPADVLYTADATPICAACNAKLDLVETDKRAAANIVKAGWAAVGTGALAFFGPFALLGIITYFFVAGTLISAIFAIQGLARGNERFTQHLTAAQRTTVWICAVVGTSLAAVTVMGVPARLAWTLFHRS
jgi:hypothetical protein